MHWFLLRWTRYPLQRFFLSRFAINSSLCPHMSSLAACPCNPGELTIVHVLHKFIFLIGRQKAEEVSVLWKATKKTARVNSNCGSTGWLKLFSFTYKARNFGGIISILLGQTRNEDFGGLARFWPFWPRLTRRTAVPLSWWTSGHDNK